MMTVKHVTTEGETTFGVERVRFEKAVDTETSATPATLWADGTPITGGTVYVMNERGSTVAKYDLDGRPR